MRFIVMIKATADSEAGVMPTEEEFAEMGRFNEELVKAGVMVSGEGLHPSSKGARVHFSGDKRRVRVVCSISSVSSTDWSLRSTAAGTDITVRAFMIGKEMRT